MKLIPRLFPLFVLLAALGQPTQTKHLGNVNLDSLYLGGASEVAAQGTGNWTPIADGDTAGNPTGRHETSFVMAGGKFYLIAGREAADIDIFDPATNTWTAGAPTPISPRPLHHFQPVVVDGLIFAVMAYTGQCCGTDETGATHVYIYDPVLDLWMTGPEIPANRRRGSTGVVQHNDTLYIMGGLQFGHGAASTLVYDFFDSYNPYTNTWAVLPDKPRPRDHFGAAIVGDKIYAAGGRDTGPGNGLQGDTISAVDVYDISDNQWTTLTSAPIPTERGGTAIATLDNDVIVIGGERTDQSLAFDTVEALDTTTNQWQTLDSLNAARHGTTAAVCNGTVWVAGGSPVKGGGSMINIERYHPVSPTNCTVPQITASNLSASSGVFAGGAGAKTITVSTSGGNQAIFVNDIRLENNGQGAFSIVNAPSDRIIIAPNGSISIQVAYTGSNPGTDAAQLVLETPQKGRNFVVALTSVESADVDIDNNGFITPSDAAYVINRVGTDDLTADVTGDGFVTNADADQVLQQLGQTFP